MNEITKLINWSELSRYIIGGVEGNRTGIRSNKIPKKHIKRLDGFFKKELPYMWEELKEELFDTN